MADRKAAQEECRGEEPGLEPTSPCLGVDTDVRETGEHKGVQRRIISNGVAGSEGGYLHEAPPAEQVPGRLEIHGGIGKQSGPAMRGVHAAHDAEDGETTHDQYRLSGRARQSGPMSSPASGSTPQLIEVFERRTLYCWFVADCQVN